MVILAGSLTVLHAQNLSETPTAGNAEDKERLGFSTRHSLEMTGAISYADGEELERSPTTNLTQAFPGRFSGLYTRESSSGMLLNIRGTSRSSVNYPIVVIDGVVFNYMVEEILRNYLTAEQIETVAVLKDVSAQALYGSQSANGVIVINTRKGAPGKLRITARVNQSFQQVTTRPPSFSSAEYAMLRNEAGYNDGRVSPLYYDDEIEKYRTGSDPLMYPDNDWYDMFFNNFAMAQKVNVNLSGGDNRIRFFSTIGMMHQGGQFKIEQKDYNPGHNTFRINFMSNVQARLGRRVEAYLFMTGAVIRDRLAGDRSANQIYESLFYFPPNLYGPVTPEVLDPNTGELLHPGGQVVTTDNVTYPTYGSLNRSGVKNNTHINISSQFGLNFDLGFITKGLKASGTMGYQIFTYNNRNTLQKYERWGKTNENFLNFEKIGSDENTPLAYTKYTREYKTITFKAELGYARNFGAHSLGAMAYASNQHLEREDRTAPWNIPGTRIDLGAEATYSYSGRYHVKVNTGASGTDLYARDKRYVMTPSVSGAWVLSEERFLKNLTWLDNLRLRAAYGITANEYVYSRYSYLDDISFAKGGPIGEFQYITTENEYGNPNLEPEKSRKQNYGIDIGILKSLSISVDVFKERMENMVISGTADIPVYQGIPLSIYPYFNRGVFENRGLEIELQYHKDFNRFLSLEAGGFITATRNKVVYVNESPRTEEYAYRYRSEGFPVGQQFGYLVDYANGNGFYNSEDEMLLIYEFGTPRLGDLKYKDLNGDNVINEQDMAPIGWGSVPRFYYGFNMGGKYRNLDFNILFQGVGKYSATRSGMGVYETSYDGVFGSLHRNAWTRERYENGEKITAPALSLTTSTSHQTSDYYLYDLSYLRLKNMEIGYSLNEKISRSMHVDQIRFFVSGQNLLTFSRMKSKDFGPEGTYGSLPVYRIYSVGLSIGF